MKRTTDNLIQRRLLDKASYQELSKEFGLSKPELQRFFRERGLPWRNLGPKKNLSLGRLSSFQESVLVGTMLGDGCLGRTRNKGNARYRIVHGMPQKEYAQYKYEIMSPFSKWIHETLAQAGNGKWYPRVESETNTTPEFTWWYLKFYKDGVKTVPHDIKNYLNPIALAFWFMDDGSEWDFGSSLRLSTNSFSIEEVKLLIRYKLARMGYVKESAPETTKRHPNDLVEDGGIVRPSMRIEEGMRNHTPLQNKNLESVVPCGDESNRSASVAVKVSGVLKKFRMFDPVNSEKLSLKRDNPEPSLDGNVLEGVESTKQPTEQQSSMVWSRPQRSDSLKVARDTLASNVEGEDVLRPAQRCVDSSRNDLGVQR